MYIFILYFVFYTIDINKLEKITYNSSK